MRTLGALLAAVTVLGTATFVRFPSARATQPIAAPPAEPGNLYGTTVPPFAALPGTTCSAASCHGSGEIGKPGGEHSTWAPEVFSDGPSDPHSQAYRVLFNGASVRMAELLKMPEPPHRTALCLKCHAGATPSEQGHVVEGVDCAACHGPAEKWLAAHYQTDWKGLTNREKFERYGFVPTKNLTARATNCTGCHVGSSDREVNHDLIAAGHPRLAFEYTRFHFQPAYRKHWIEPTPQPDFEVRAWTIGQAATLRAAVQLLKARADRAANDDAHTPWPEFSGYGCYSCHQTIGTGDGPRGANAGKKLGAMAWETWSNGAADVAASLTPEVFPGQPSVALPQLAALRTMMQKPNPKPAQVRDQARAAEAELDRWLASLQDAEDRSSGDRVPTDASRKLMHALAANALKPDRSALKGSDWDFLSANYLGTAAMYHAVGGAAYEPGWKSPVHDLDRLLRFPKPSNPNVQRFDGPADFGPGKLKAVGDRFRSLWDATSTGANR